MPSPYLKAASLGMIAGMRSMGAPAQVSAYLARTHPVPLHGTPLAWLESPVAAAVLRTLAAGEVVADKLPKTPARTEPASVAFRAASGGLCGAALCAAEGEEALIGAAIGALAAVASTFAFYHLRRRLDKGTGAPDALFAVVEDALVVGIGRRVLGA